MAKGKVYVKLRDAGTIFFDMHSQVKVAGDQIVHAEKSGKIAEAISSGFLVEVPEDEAKKHLAATKEEKAKVADAGKSEIANLKAEHSTEVEGLKEAHAKEVEELKSAHSTDVEGLNTQIEELKKQLEEATKSPDAPEASKKDADVKAATGK